MLAALMWYSHTDIFHRLEQYNGKELTFGLQALNCFLALGFSILTAICVRKIREYKYAALFGVFDGFAIFLHFQSNISPHAFNWIGSIFLGSLMFFLVSMIWKLADAERKREAKAEIQEPGQTLEPAAVPAVAEQPQQPETAETDGESMVQTTLIIQKKEKQYATLKALNGAIARGSEGIEYYFQRATADVQAEYLERHPEITVQQQVME